MADKSREEYLKAAQDAARIKSENIRLELELLGQVSSSQKKQLQREYDINMAKETYIELLKEQNKLGGEKNNELKKAVELQGKKTEQLIQSTKQYKQQVEYSGRLKENFLGIWSYLMDADGAIKSINRELGLGVERSDMLRNNIEDSAVVSAMMGAGVKDITDGYKAYVEQTGRVVELSGKELQNLVAIGKATNLGVEGAGKLAGQFEIMGLNIERTREIVEGTIESSERMGVNATKVLQKVGDNFERMQNFTFRRGVQSMVEMAQMSEKYKINIDSALASAEKSRRLDGAIEMMAKLQVMGGEFAKTDPFQMLFLSRNDPTLYAKKIQEMTKGIATFRKMADGTFENFISPVDIDRLKISAEAMGMQADELIKISRRTNLVQSARQAMIGSGLSEDEMSYVENLANLDKETGKLYVRISNVRKDVRDLASDDISRLKAETESLEARAKRAQTFDEAFTATIEELKALLLPMLQGVNKMLRWANEYVVMPMTELFTNTPEWVKEIMKVVGAGGFFMALFLKMKPLTTILGKLGSSVGKIFGLGGGGGGAVGGFITGIAKGLAALADPRVLLAIGAIDLSLLAVGFSIKMVGEGINDMSTGIGNLLDKASGKDLYSIAGGLGAIVAAMSVGGLVGGIGGVLTKITGGGIEETVTAIASNASNIEKVGNGFEKIYTVLNSSDQQFKNLEKTISSISNMEVGKLSFVGELNKLMSKPLMVEFAQKDIAINVNLNNYIDGKKFTESLNIVRRVEIKTQDYKSMKSGPRGIDNV